MRVAPESRRVDYGEFIKRLEVRYPQVFSAISDIERGLLHCEMAVLARTTSKAIECGDMATVTDHFAFMEEVLASSDPHVENAVYVSYLENVFLGEDSAEFLVARSKLPARLAKALDQLERHFEALANGDPTRVES